MNRNLSRAILVVLTVALIAVGGAVTYTLFENAVSGSIDLIWKDWLGTDQTRWLIVPLIFGFTAVFLWLQHILDAPSERHEEAGLGHMPKPTLANYSKILLIGYFSLLAGASLGPEAILVPACTLLGAYVGSRVYSSRKPDVALMAGMGLVSLFTAFFHSYLIGILSLLLVRKQTGAKLTLPVIALGVFNAVLTYFVLKLIDSKPALTLPDYSWGINLTTIFWSLALACGGFVAIHLMSRLHGIFARVYTHAVTQQWWIHTLIAASGLTLIYLIGGPLVEFTGNHSIVPLFEQAPALGALSIIWILLCKIAAISWSKALGYRGGMIFPTIFLAAACVALLEFYMPEFNAIYGLIATLVGAFIANAKTGILV